MQAYRVANLESSSVAAWYVMQKRGPTTVDGRNKSVYVLVRLMSGKCQVLFLLHLPLHL